VILKSFTCPISRQGLKSLSNRSSPLKWTSASKQKFLTTSPNDGEMGRFLLVSYFYPTALGVYFLVHLSGLLL